MKSGPVMTRRHSNGLQARLSVVPILVLVVLLLRLACAPARPLPLLLPLHLSSAHVGVHEAEADFSVSTVGECLFCLVFESRACAGMATGSPSQGRCS